MGPTWPPGFFEVESFSWLQSEGDVAAEDGLRALDHPATERGGHTSALEAGKDSPQKAGSPADTPMPVQGDPCQTVTGGTVR